MKSVTVKVSRAVSEQLDLLKIIASRKYNARFSKGKLIAISLKNLQKIMNEKDEQ
ncbi:hypothetical protein I0P70_03590 [Pontibacter sp. FD36]|uniref:hypothetical protein n=1 Tax=Pontibacter sp. FD36 TaxID=2789860 RepID=UPI0018AA2549|nr:hypothetical protein [Pontibacter sp. FD36]MBF8962320.1 hypothetical protein [Pontibacter sp. FD36]